MYINKQYTPKELILVEQKLKSIIEAWNDHKGTKSTLMMEEKSLEDYIIISLFHDGYRIVKTGNN